MPTPEYISSKNKLGEQDPQEHQASQIGRTNETRYEVQALEPGTLYNLSMWAERNNAASWAQSLLASTGEMGPPSSR